ncbi:MAG: hypothetical protein KF763_10215 [Cyclobacteriaceae bacterium]|nr:hypothetical protein [Cyclobacteriaceae bacterium]
MNQDEISEGLSKIEKSVISGSKKFDDEKKCLKDIFPELILKCFDDRKLFELLLIRNTINSSSLSSKTKNFLFVALVSLLREVSSAATGWPYIAPKKIKTSSKSKDVLREYRR